MDDGKHIVDCGVTRNETNEYKLRREKPISLVLAHLGEYTVCIFGDEVLPYRSPFAP